MALASLLLGADGSSPCSAERFVTVSMAVLVSYETSHRHRCLAGTRECKSSLCAGGKGSLAFSGITPNCPQLTLAITCFGSGAITTWMVGRADVMPAADAVATRQPHLVQTLRQPESGECNASSRSTRHADEADGPRRPRSGRPSRNYRLAFSMKSSSPRATPMCSPPDGT